jgi:hypothetical protein
LNVEIFRIEKNRKFSKNNSLVLYWPEIHRPVSASFNLRREHLIASIIMTIWNNKFWKARMGTDIICQSCREFFVVILRLRIFSGFEIWKNRFKVERWPFSPWVVERWWHKLSWLESEGSSREGFSFATLLDVPVGQNLPVKNSIRYRK